MFTLTVFDMLLFEGRPVLAPAQWGTWSERVNKKTSLSRKHICIPNTSTQKHLCKITKFSLGVLFAIIINSFTRHFHFFLNVMQTFYIFLFIIEKA